MEATMISHVHFDRRTDLRLALGMGMLFAVFLASHAKAQTTERVSIDSGGVQGNNWSGLTPSFSPDGRYVAFFSEATNLVPVDANGFGDLFVYDRQTRTTEMVSVASDGTQANHTSFDPRISANGRYVAFSSTASNLVAGDTGPVKDIFVHDRLTGSTECVTCQANHASDGPSISGDGRYVAFSSGADNLVLNDTNGVADVFVLDSQTGVVQRVSVSSSGGQGNYGSGSPHITDDGRYVAFLSLANNLTPGDGNGFVDAFVRDRQTGTTVMVSVASNGVEGYGFADSVSISRDGRYVAFGYSTDDLVPDDTNGASDVFVHDRLTGETRRVSVASDGTQGSAGTAYPTLSSYDAQISSNGRYVAFSSYATNLVDGDVNGLVDIFVHDRLTGTTELASVSADGAHGDGSSFAPGISGDGRFVGFQSYAANLVPSDTNGVTDMFVRDRGAQPSLANISTRASVGTGDNVAVGGFIISGVGNKRVLLRGFGPTLSGAVTGSLANPVLDLYADHDSNPLTTAVLIVSNDDWGTPLTTCPAPAVSCESPQDIIDTGKSADSYAPTDPNRHLDAALLVTLPPGTYTATLRGVSSGTGIGLVAVNDVDTNPTAVLVNISTRAFVGTGENVAVGGFIISGTASKQVLVRGFGPTLSGAVAGVLANPVLELYADHDSNPLTPAILIVNNDDWGTALSTCPAPAVACGTPQDIIATGRSADSYAPTHPNRHLDAALLITLPPGTYTATLRGVNSGTGVGLVAINAIGP
jgi:Tol biopolymer transport system component